MRPKIMRDLKMKFRLICIICIFSLASILSCGSVDSSSGKTVKEEKKQTQSANSSEDTKKSEKEREKIEYPRKRERHNMVRIQIERRGVEDKKVLEAMRYIPRHEFVSPLLELQAYDDNPIPIGFGQTISQPYVVALMTEALKLDENSKALEIGTGSGYQAAVLAEIAQDVYTIEIIKELSDSASKVLKRLGYENIETKHADGYFGWEEKAPFDAIIVTAASDHVPPPLIKQLKTGGRMCIPLGPPHQIQRLVLITKNEDGKIKTQDITPVRFVPLTRQLK